MIALGGPGRIAASSLVIAWLLFFILAVPVVRSNIRIVWLAHHLCPECGYDMRASPDRCPECGFQIPQKKDSPETTENTVFDPEPSRREGTGKKQEKK
jgi:hypothetical protein